MRINNRLLYSCFIILLSAFSFSDNARLTINVNSDVDLNATNATVRVTIYGVNLGMADGPASKIIKFNEVIDALPAEVNVPWPENAHLLIDDSTFNADDARFWAHVWVDTDNDGYSCADDYNDVDRSNTINPQLLTPLNINVAKNHSGRCRTPEHDSDWWNNGDSAGDRLVLHLTSMIYHEIDWSKLHVSIYGYNPFWADTTATEIIHYTQNINEVPKEVLIPWPPYAYELIKNPPAFSHEEALYYAIAWVDTDNDGQLCANDLSMDYQSKEAFSFDFLDINSSPITLFLSPGYSAGCNRSSVAD